MLTPLPPPRARVPHTCCIRAAYVLQVLDVVQWESRVRMTQLSFTDFVESVCRIGMMKPMPTDEEV